MLAQLVVYKIENVKVNIGLEEEKGDSGGENMKGLKKFIFKCTGNSGGRSQEVQCREILSRVYTNQMLKSSPLLRFSQPIFPALTEVSKVIPEEEANSQSPSKDTDARSDIHNRKILRLMKKFFNLLFRYHNDKLKNKRFVNVPSDIIIAELKKLLQVYMPETPIEEMPEFFFRFLNFNSSDNLQLSINSEAAQAGADAFLCTHKYKMARFNALMISKYFRVLIISFMRLRNTSPNTVISMKDSRKWGNQYDMNREKFNDLLTKYLHPSLDPKIENKLQQVYAQCVSFSVGTRD